MAIQFARIGHVQRSAGAKACCKGAYNARTIIKDEKTNIVYNFQNRGDSVYHIVLLPDHVNKTFKNTAVLMNEVERSEKRKDSVLLKDIVLALPDDKELTLEDRIIITHRLIEKRGWVKEGLGVQVDIHKPHDGEKNWHAHLLVTTRRFTEDGNGLSTKKAVDLEPKIVGGKNRFVIKEDQQIHEDLRDIINDYFKELGLDKRVDSIGINPQEHIGPVRMRSVMNSAVIRNEERRIAEVEHLNNGVAVLDKVTRHMSVFNKSDLMRAVKCVPNKETQERLVEDALADKSIIGLFDSDGKETNCYTTTGVRGEEEKIIRLAGYVANEKNVISFGGNKAIDRVNRLIADEKASNRRLSGEQERALTELLLGVSGVRLLRGSAGSGKSYVLGKVCSIAESTGINVIGLAPTHKARVELAKVGYKQNDTVKGMLFKLANSRFSLPKHSLIVIDEGGMVGNDDYQEILRVSATRKCNVILAGDERQLSSVGRGGMFEVISEKHGSSTVFDIRRQSSNWGREVASCFASGRVLEGLTILERNERIKWGGNADKSMQELLGDWGGSKYDIGDRIILAVENRHVNALNAGARQYLKANGKLEGEEISVSGNYYMKGDRVLITGTNKELGVINGDLGEILHASMNKFVIGIAGKEKEIEFNPKEYEGFKHGYATTVFKAQGASIKDVYVFHDRFSGIRNGYVALSRHIDELKLYTNRESTIDAKMLVKQLSRDFDKGSSLRYLTEEEIGYRDDVESAKKTITGKFLVGVLNVLEKVTDKYIPKSEYYSYKEPVKASSTVEKVIDNFVVEEEAAGFVLENKIAVGENADRRISNVLARSAAISKKGAATKEGFYANTDYMGGQKSRVDLRAQWDKEAEELRHHLKFKSEIVARELLGEPNKRLSNGRELRYGEHGKIVVRISGEKAGMWHDFSESKGGDLFSLTQHIRGGEFKDTAEYLRGVVGMESTTSLRLVHDHANNNEYVDRLKVKKFEEKVEKAKIKLTSDLLTRAKAITDKSVAHRYLREERNITCALSDDIRTTGIYEKEAGRSFPALIAFSRDKDGNITGGQRLLLDSRTYGKAKVDVPKKSFGHISGSFVEVEKPEKPNITIIAEGLETALSVKQALSEHSEKEGNTKTVQILCSLGISNIKNYDPKKGEKIIIAADNDGPDSITGKTVLNAKALLEEKGAFVEMVKPDREGDFNDLLKAGESKLINSLFAPAIASHSAKTLEEYVRAQAGSKASEIKSVIGYLSLLFEQQQLAAEVDKDNPNRPGELDLRLVDVATLKSLSRDCEFLIEHKIDTDEELMKLVKNTDDLKSIAGNLFNKAQPYVRLLINSDLNKLEELDQQGKGRELLERIEEIDKKRQTFSPYLEEDERAIARFKRITHRAEIYTIIEENQTADPELGIRFKEEMDAMDRFNNTSIEEVLNLYKDQGLAKAMEYANSSNKNHVLSHLEGQYTIRDSQSLKEGEYVKAIANDKVAMRYIDQAIDEKIELNPFRKSQYCLMDYKNQRDINVIIDQLSEKGSGERFKEKAFDLQVFGNSQQLREGIEIYKTHNMESFVSYVETTCVNTITKRIQNELVDILHGRRIESFDGKNYQDKSEYLQSISENKEVIKYIEKSSNIGKEIEALQKNKNLDFER